MLECDIVSVSYSLRFDVEWGMQFPRFHTPCPAIRFLRVRLFLLVSLRDVEPQPIGI